MEKLKIIAIVFLAMFFTLTVSAQSATATVAKAYIAGTDPRTGKPITDPIVSGKKGPNGETVYKAATNVNYYYDNDGQRVTYKNPMPTGPNGETLRLSATTNQYFYIDKHGQRHIVQNPNPSGARDK